MSKAKIAAISAVAILVIAAAVILIGQGQAPSGGQPPAPANDITAFEDQLSDLEDFIDLENLDDLGLGEIVGNWG